MITQHIIGRQTIEIAFHNSGEAMNLRNRLSDMCKCKLPAAMEKVFDEKVIHGKILRLEKVEVDVGELNAANWEEELMQNVTEQLRELIVFQIPDTNQKKERLIISKENEERTIIMDEKEGRLLTLTHFLETGMLPWFASVRKKSELEIDINNWMEHKYFRLLNELKRVLLQNEIALQRFVSHFTEMTVRKMILEYSRNGNLLADWKNFWQTTLNDLGFSIPKQHEILLMTELKSSLQSDIEAEKYFTSLILHQLNSEKKKTLIQLLLKQKLKQENKQDAHFLKLKKDVEERLLKEVRESGNDLFGWENKIQMEKTISELKEHPSDNILKQKSSPKINNKEGLYIHNAGLVLLHPFLQPLFENLGYTEKQNWTNKEAQERAVLLTEFMASGNEEFTEFDLMLNKILCGVDLEEPVSVKIGLSDFEKDEAKDVLNSVIKHWQALKSTSVEGLQSTFFMRDGKVTFDETRWLLQVEQRSFDILMNRLPWGISVIKLPWMQNLMNVEWI